MDAETFSRANRQADTQEQRFLDVWSSLLADVETETMDADSDWRKEHEGDPGKIQGAWDRLRRMPWYTPGGIGLINAIFPARDYTDTSIDFTWDGDYNQLWLTGIGGTISEVEGMDQVLQRLNPDPVFFDTYTSDIIIVPAGTPGAEPQEPDPDADLVKSGITPGEAVELFLANASQTEKDNLTEAFNINLPPGATQNEDTLRRNLRSYFTAVKNAEGSVGIRPFDVSYMPGDWFSQLSTDSQSAVMALLGTTNFSPEREAGGASALQSIGVLLGTGLGAYAGFKTAGPAGIIPGAETGANVAAAVTP